MASVFVYHQLSEVVAKFQSSQAQGDVKDNLPWSREQEQPREQTAKQLRESGF